MKVLVAFACLFQEAAAMHCLPDAIPAEQRKNLSTNGGAPYPVGIWVGAWEAGWLTSSLVQILIEERLGYRAVLSGAGPGALDAFHALTGCSQPANFSDRGCGPQITYHHVNVETWADGYRSEWDQIQAQYASMAPVNLGSTGYAGRSGGFVPKEVLNQALYQDGIALDFYRGWNSSWNEPSRFFDSIASVDRSQMDPCNATRFYTSLPNEVYLRVTGDTGGVQTLDGDVVAVCPDGYFWISPACRADHTKCVPYLTGYGGWGLDVIMQQAAMWDMPIALGVAKVYSQLPQDVKSAFFWWTPDTTFINMAPGEIMPLFNAAQWGAGDKRTGAQDAPITKMVSQDLSSLAPNVVELIQLLRLEIDDLNGMLRERMVTGDSYENITCRWLQANPASWQSWVPDNTRCFPGFGMYDTGLREFVGSREDPTYLECRACVSGTHSTRVTDATGITHACVPCEPGTAQPSGAAESCDPCRLGEYQNETGSQACNRCGIGEYQDQSGSRMCTLCPAGGTTLGLGSVSLADCGCTTGHIDVGNGTLSCHECGPGLSCPALSKLEDLTSGSKALGEAFLAQVLPGFYSTGEKPLEMYLCSDEGRCPGGQPGVCAGGLERPACTDCPNWQTFSGEECEECSAWRGIAWILAIVSIFVFLVIAYYLMTSTVTAKATVLFTTTCAFGMTVSTLQSVGIIGMMTVDFPAELQGIMGVLQIFVLDIDSYAFNCVAGNNAPLRYILSVIFFPACVFWLIGCHFASQWLPQRFQKYRWEDAKTKSTVGQFLQVGFSTMGTIAMVPMMCFRHPSGSYSILKYPTVSCGSDEHTVMLVGGILLLFVGVIGFLVVCTTCATLAPKWTARGQHARVRAIRFLVFRFRLDTWWYGVPLLTRGPLLSLPIVLATDYPPVQVLMVTLVLMVFLTLESITWPWKVPLLNVVDCFMSLCITMLVANSALALDALEESMQGFSDGFATTIGAMLGASMILLVGVTVSGLVYRGALGSQKELWFLNLQTIPASELLTSKLRALAVELLEMKEQDISKAVGAMAVFDINLLLKCMSLLAMEVTTSVPGDAAMKAAMKARLSSSSFAPAPKPKASPKPAEPAKPVELLAEPAKLETPVHANQNSQSQLQNSRPDNLGEVVLHAEI